MVARAEGEILIIEVEARADHPDQVRRDYEKSRGKAGSYSSFQTMRLGIELEGQ